MILARLCVLKLCMNEANASSFAYKLSRAVKYLEVISKSLISHFVNLESSEKQKIIKLMYSAPNRILFALLSSLDYERTVDERFSLFGC